MSLIIPQGNKRFKKTSNRRLSMRKNQFEIGDEVEITEGDFEGYRGWVVGHEDDWPKVDFGYYQPDLLELGRDVYDVYRDAREKLTKDGFYLQWETFDPIILKLVKKDR